MQSFIAGNPSNLPSQDQNRFVGGIFISLFIFGLLLRYLACFHAMGFAHPDEHQQYLEQAYRAIHGYGVTFWEQDAGMRHWFYPGIFAGLLWVMESIGIHDPVLQNAIFHFLVAITVFGATTFFAWEFHRRGDTPAALFLMLSTTIFPEVIYVHCRVLTENAMMAPMLLGVIWLHRYPFVAGILFGCAFGIRFHAGFMIAMVGIIAWLTNYEKKPLRLGGQLPRLCLGLGVSLFGLGVIDWLTYGSLFHSPIAYVQKNVIEGMAKEFGVDPWYQYFEWAALWGWGLFAFFFVVISLGAIREWKIASLIAIFVIVHSLVEHKEGRFLWPIIPLGMALVSVVFSVIYRWLQPKYRLAYTGICLTALLIGVGIRVPVVPWTANDYSDVARLLHHAGQQSDVKGISLYRISIVRSGNYFFLQRNVPLWPIADGEFYFQDPAKPFPQSAWKEGKLNYIITPQQDKDVFSPYQAIEVKVIGDHILYRLPSP